MEQRAPKPGHPRVERAARITQEMAIAGAALFVDDPQNGASPKLKMPPSRIDGTIFFLF